MVPPQELWMIGWSKEEVAHIVKRRRQARNIIDARERIRMLADVPPPPPSWDGLEPFDDGWEEEVSKLAPNLDSLDSENGEHLTPPTLTDRDAIAQALVREMSKVDSDAPLPELGREDLTPEELAAVEAGDTLQAKPSKKAFHAWLDAALRATGCDVDIPDVPHSVDIEVGGKTFRLKVSIPQKKS
jgi:hypothetical protein